MKDESRVELNLGMLNDGDKNIKWKKDDVRGGGDFP